jgi:hypothetical protein
MPARERGGVGFIVILVALVIGALIATQALKQYGLASQAAASKAAGPVERPAPAAAGIEAQGIDTAPPTASGALERARGVEDTLRRQADERAAQMDGVK